MIRAALLLLLLVAIEAQSQSCEGGIPTAEEAAILKAHNTLRKTISDGKFSSKGKKMPAAATPIPDLTWDCEIAASAQSSSDRCLLTASKGRVNLGENIYQQWNNIASVPLTGKGKVATDSWSYEFTYNGWTSANFTQSVFSTGVTHATQMVWAKSTAIGCGMTSCKNGAMVVVVCQYRDQGNVLNQNIYEPVV